MLKARLLDLGPVTAVRSQTVYHGVAQRAAPYDPPTLCLSFPDHRYVSIGYHQEANKEVDLAYCLERGLPVLRRMVGGGVVLLDENQLFFNLIVPNGRLPELGLPLRLSERYRVLVRPAVAAYRRLGVQAGFRPVNDIHVEGRKITGTGMASIGDALVFVGSIIRDFDHALMARVLRFSDEPVRREVLKSMKEHVTSLRHETGMLPEVGKVRDALLGGFRDKLRLELQPGSLREDEEREIADLDALFSSDEWLHEISWGESRARRLAINCAVRFVEAEHRASDGLLRMVVRIVEGRIDELLLAGDFSLLPAGVADELRRSLIGAEVAAGDLQARIERSCRKYSPNISGVNGEDFSALAGKLAQAANA